MNYFFFAAFRFLEDFFLDVFFGTFLPLALASESPIAIACLRLFTFRPERPLFNVPALRFFIARLTSEEAFFEYLRAMINSPVGREQSSHQIKVPNLQPCFTWEADGGQRFEF
ncbi:MAG: hypothetical protein KGK01_16510 [Bradyrhizobium sp.]|nr:hypothetical protein [Pseudomonadota bacterium]MDE2067581.1 hypothetical protein [Bradyrhizobium sp.]MDE2243968.1 hypothetical protein [Bradyrhizobium sp.]MDE2469907.1 hypothetical protein [Bradyrhizobium sp.]